LTAITTPFCSSFSSFLDYEIKKHPNSKFRTTCFLCIATTTFKNVFVFRDMTDSLSLSISLLSRHNHQGQPPSTSYLTDPLLLTPIPNVRGAPSRQPGVTAVDRSPAPKDDKPFGVKDGCGGLLRTTDEDPRFSPTNRMLSFLPLVRQLPASAGSLDVDAVPSAIVAVANGGTTLDSISEEENSENKSEPDCSLVEGPTAFVRVTPAAKSVAAPSDSTTTPVLSTSSTTTTIKPKIAPKPSLGALHHPILGSRVLPPLATNTRLGTRQSVVVWQIFKPCVTYYCPHCLEIDPCLKGQSQDCGTITEYREKVFLTH
jgi:hypothetical protein